MNATKSKEEGHKSKFQKKWISEKKLGVVKGDDLFEKDSQLTWQVTTPNNYFKQQQLP